MWQLAEKHFVATTIKITRDLKENTAISVRRFYLVSMYFSNYKTHFCVFWVRVYGKATYKCTKMYFVRAYHMSVPF